MSLSFTCLVMKVLMIFLKADHFTIKTKKIFRLRLRKIFFYCHFNLFLMNQFLKTAQENAAVPEIRHEENHPDFYFPY